MKKTAMSLQEPDYLDLNKANGKLAAAVAGDVTDDAKSESNILLHNAIDIVRPASTDGTCDSNSRLTLGFEPRSLASRASIPSDPSQRYRPQSGDWSNFSASMDHLSLESLKEPSQGASNGLASSRRHTVSIHQDDIEPFTTKVPARTQAAIEKVAEIINKMGGQLRTHVQDNGGTSSSPFFPECP